LVFKEKGKTLALDHQRKKKKGTESSRYQRKGESNYSSEPPEMPTDSTSYKEVLTEEVFFWYIFSIYYFVLKTFQNKLQCRHAVTG
jgi:hypothetical protein